MFWPFLGTARKRSLRRLCFHRCLSVHREGCLSLVLGRGVSATHTPRQTLPGQRPPGKTPPGRHPLDRHHLGKHPLGQTPLCPVHVGIHTPLPSACWDTVNKWAVRIPLECILVIFCDGNTICWLRYKSLHLAAKHLFQNVVTDNSYLKINIIMFHNSNYFFIIWTKYRYYFEVFG